jgi:phage tail tape-measure protein
LTVASFKAVNEQKRKLIEEELERQKKAADLFAKKEEAFKKIAELKNSSISKTTEKIVSKKTVGAIGGSVIGATLGGSLGIAGKFLGTMVFLNGAWVLAPIGGLLGYIAVKKINKKKEEKEEQKKIKEYGENINDQTRNKQDD